MTPKAVNIHRDLLSVWKHYRILVLDNLCDIHQQTIRSLVT